MERTLAIVIVVLAMAASALGQTTVAMRPSVEIGSARAVTLGEVADISGPDAAKLAELEVLGAQETAGASRGVITVDAQRVRTALEKAGVNWGRVSLRAVTSVVRVSAKDAQASGADATKRDAATRDVREEAALVDRSKPDSVRVAIADRLGELLGVAQDSIKLGFKAQDSRVLDESTIGRVVDIQPGAGAASGRMPVRVQIYEGDRLVLSATVGVEVQVRRATVIARGGIDRRQMIREDAVLVEERWVEPSQGGSLTLDGAVGMYTRTRLAAGEVITAGNVEAAVVVKRGEQVLVDCVSGGVVVQVKARAVREGRDGEVVDFTPLASKRTFSARMNGRGRAVMLMSGSVGE